MSSLIIEIGNTAIKAALAEGTTLGKTFRYQGEKRLDFILSLIKREIPDITVVASSSELYTSDIRKMKALCTKVIVLDPNHREVLEKYGIPQSLSYDRAASVIAARYLFNGKSCMVFDFGTTLTIDSVSSEGQYEGGSISLGMRTRFKVLARYSRTLPLVSIPESPELAGMDAVSSIESGVVSGIMFEIQGYMNNNPEKMIVFTGGDANYFAKRMKNSIFVVCNLVLMGLALITEDYVD